MRVERELVERVWVPGAERGAGLRAWRDMLADLWGARELLWQLARRDLTVSYRQSLLGYAWALLMPLLTVSVFAYLSSTRLLPIDETPLPYPVYALWGVVLWQLFASTLSATTSSLANAGALVTRVDFAKEVIVVAALARPLSEFLAKLVMVLVMMWIYDVSLAPAMLLTVPLVLVVAAMALGMGLILSLVNLVARDVTNLVGMVALFGMFGAPVLYPPPQTEPFALLVVLNPFSPILMATHDLLAGGPVQHAALLGAAVLFALLCLLTGWRIFRVVIRRVTERA